jgi:flagellar protein FliS
MNLPSQTQAAALARYGAVKVTTANPGNLLVMLYDGLLRFLREARAAIEKKERSRAGERMSRANAIIVHLVETLDPSHSPDLCARLQPLYLFWMAHLLRANIDQDTTKLDELIGMVLPLRDAWAKAVAEVNGAKR